MMKMKAVGLGKNQKGLEIFLIKIKIFPFTLFCSIIKH